MRQSQSYYLEIDDPKKYLMTDHDFKAFLAFLKFI